MKLRTKFTASFILAAVVLCGVTMQISSVVMGNSYEALEMRNADSDFYVIENAVRAEVEAKFALLADIGKQDQLYTYMAKPPQPDRAVSFPISAEILSHSLNLTDVDLIGFFNADGLRFGVAQDEAGDILPLHDHLVLAGAGWTALRSQLEPQSNFAGILNSVSGPLFITVSPIVRTDGSAPPIGHVIVGRNIDRAFVEKIKRRTNIDLEIKADGALGFVEVDFTSVSLVHGTAAGELNDDLTRVFHKAYIDNDRTVKTATYYSEDKLTSVAISSITPRFVVAFGESSIKMLILIFAGSMVIILLVLQGLLERLLVAPISTLTQMISGRETAKLQDVIKQNQRSDEIGELYQTYHSLNQANENTTEAMKAAVTKAEAANVSKSEFLANMSHEIRTPMNGVLGMAQVMRGTKLSEVQKHYIDLMYESGMALMTVINDILDFSKIESGKMEFDPEPFNFHDALESVMALLGSQARDKEIDLISEIDGIRGRALVGDVGRIRQVVTNLLGNAIKFTGTGYVLVRAKIEDVDARFSTIRVEFEDTGIGIPDDKLDLIFDKFTQAEGATTRQFGGTGLGLSISRRIIELMGGRIGVDSVYGQGSTFWFEITLESQSASLPCSPKVESCDLTGVVALIVDDIDVNCRIMSELLTGWGAKAYCVDSAAKGLAVLRGIAAQGGQTLPIVVSDFQMPGMDGLQFVTQIRSDPTIANTPVMVLSSVDDTQLKKDFRALNVVSVLEKPAATRDLIQGLHKMALLCGLQQPEAPLADTAPSYVSALVATDVPARKSPKILVAEDNAVNRDVLRLMFENEPYDLHFVHDGQEAVDAIRVSDFDLVLMDISMPVMDGIEATHAIRQLEADAQVPGTPIIAVTAHAMNTERDRYLAAGMDEHLPKPIIKEKLIDLIEVWQGKTRPIPDAFKKSA